METIEERDQKYQVTVTQNDIREIKQEVSDLAHKVADVHMAIIGSPLAKDGGMVQRLADCEKSVDAVSSKLENLEKDLAARTLKSELYIKIIWGLGGSIVAGIFTTVLYYAFKK